MSLLRRQRELTAGVRNDGEGAVCAKCSKTKGNGEGWLCSDCLKEKWKNWNPYGLKRFEGVEYPCNCYGSGTNEKDQIVIIENIERHDKTCKKRKSEKVWREDERICDCLVGSEVKNGTIIIHDHGHDLQCPIRKKQARYLDGVFFRPGPYGDSEITKAGT